MTNDLYRLRRLSCAVLVATATAAVATVVPATADAAARHAPASHAATGHAATQYVPSRGALVSAARSAHMSGEQVAAYLQQAGLPAVEGAKGVDVYSVIYSTIDVQGGPTTASGVVVLPRTPVRDLHVVSYAPGTNTTKSDAPSMWDGSDGRYTPVYFATHGFAAVAPDYLGLGSGPGHHPYVHTATEASASLDLIKAARVLAGRKKITLDSRILVTGWSQGGHAAMALGAVLQKDPVLDVAAIAPISGPFDLEHVELPAALDGRLDGRAATLYLAYWLTSMNRIYNIYDSPTTVFREPYAATVTTLFDGSQSYDTIVAGLPATPAELLTQGFIEQMANPSGALLKAIRDNDTTCEDVTAGVPVQLFSGSADRDVVIANSESCLKELKAAGVDASLIDVGVVDHFVTVPLSLPHILAWFRSRAEAPNVEG